MRYSRLQKIIVSLAVLLLLSASLAGCGLARNIMQESSQPEPTAENTLTAMPRINEAIVKALKAGEPKLRLDVTVSDDDLKDIMENLSPFWGSPTEYRTIRTFRDVDLSTEAEAKAPQDVSRIEMKLAQSDNYYVYKAYTDAAYRIPSEQTRAAGILAALPGVLSDIKAAAAQNAGSPDYALILAVHDWLVTNLSYDDTIDELSYHNGVYGALIEHRTMCLGYAEALQLILLCMGEQEVQMVVGKGNSDVGGNPDGWIGHAWNLVELNGDLLHVDATFDDPVSSDPNEKASLSHIYFGQNDAFMKKDHEWAADYYPVADGGDYYYFRENGLYTESKKEFRKTLRNLLPKKQLAEIEIAASGYEISDDDLQFIFSVRDDIKDIYRSFTDEGEVTIARLFFTYE
ncbi:MAG: hypothetical protein LBC58_03795 [Clostridiales Family XIII bacterium]|jgi:hypothetical protein|nr:hypothetical protein [Clostridiales Family XIII bacterium]